MTTTSQDVLDAGRAGLDSIALVRCTNRLVHEISVKTKIRLVTLIVGSARPVVEAETRVTDAERLRTAQRAYIDRHPSTKEPHDIVSPAYDGGVVDGFTLALRVIEEV